jgi:hypothetical protein
MKRTKVILAVLWVIMLVCCKTDGIKYQSEGVILGPDRRMCACCGGWLITIDTITYRFDSLPNKSSIDLLKVTFPMKVLLNWSLSAKPACAEKLIEIQDIVMDL